MLAVLSPEKRKTMRNTLRGLALCALFLVAGFSTASERFDGDWQTKLTCPAKGDTEGYTWQFAASIKDGHFRGEHGVAGQPGYLLLEGDLTADGSAKLSANGIAASRKYTRGVFAHSGEDYSYDVKAQFRETAGTGVRNQGLGIVGRPCTFEFTRTQAQTPAH
jgi:hypothetical protein